MNATYPTEEHERQKARKKQRKEVGIQPKRKQFKLEDHFDDCGSDLSGLGHDIVILAADYIAEPESEPSILNEMLDTLTSEKYDCYDIDTLISAHQETTSMALWFLKGSQGRPEDFDTARANLRVCSCLEEFMYVSHQHDDRDDIVEFCGGAARTSVICARRQLRTGGNFDLLTGVDLNSTRDQAVAKGIHDGSETYRGDNFHKLHPIWTNLSRE